MLLSVLPIFGVPYEQSEEYTRKQAILNERAEQFKAETDFIGEISFNHQYTMFSSMMGNFRDIEITVPQDTLIMKKIFDQVFTRLKPYIPASEGQLLCMGITRNMFGIYVSYKQLVNGYPVFGAGSLKISYYSRVKQFSIVNSTVHIQDVSVKPKLTIDDALKIYSENVLNDEILILFQNREAKFKLSYCNINEYKVDTEPIYRLCWVGGLASKLVIDAVSGEIYVYDNVSMHDLAVNIGGTALLQSDNIGNLNASNEVFNNTIVYAFCDELEIYRYSNDQGNVFFHGELISNVKAYLQSSKFTFFDGSITPESPQFTKNLTDELDPLIMFDYYDYIGNPSNQYYHSVKYLDWLSNNGVTDTLLYPELDIATGCEMLSSGQYYPLGSLIKISRESGMLSSPICHEMTHTLVYHTLGENFFSPFPPNSQFQMLFGGMDEAFSIYYPCAYRDNSSFRFPELSYDLSNTINVISILNMKWITSLGQNPGIFKV